MKYISLIISLVAGLFFHAQADDVVKWNARIDSISPRSGSIVITAEPTDGYHFYSFAPDGGYNSLEITPTATGDVTFSEIASSITPTRHTDASGEELSWWDSPVSFKIEFELGDGIEGSNIALKIRYQSCNDTSCQRPETLNFNLPFGNTRADNPTATVTATTTAKTLQQQQWWAPVNAEAPTSDQSPWMILILGFIGGLAALLTPCVWPMVPMTLSFFLKKGKATAKSKRDALTYGISIVAIYLVLGLAITLIFGASKLNELSTNAIFNIIFFLLLVMFAISFFGAFDIKLPSKWSNAIDNKAETTTGILSIFFMAFTLALVSFSCTGPIIGTLLVEAASNGSLLGPALGMGGFALGLAIPFSVFALFPSMLKGMPKTGGWLNSVKVVLGFIELILSLKFLSVADMAYGWHILDREVFLSIWIVLFILLGMYLLGKLRFSHDSPSEHTGITRFFLALASFSFAVYLLPGLWGAPLKAVSAFVPPLETQDFNLHTHDYNYTVFDDYDTAMQYASEHKMPVMVDFSGYGCVNCRNMEAEVLDTEQVRKMLSDNFVVVRLMVDDKAELPVPFTVDDNGKTKELTTVGDKWSYLQSHKFGAISQPYLIVLDNQGRPMNKPVYYDNDIDKFIDWLEIGLDNYHQ